MSLIEALYLPRNSDHHFATFLALSIGCSPRFICRLMVQQSGKTALWRPTSESLSTSNKITGSGFYQWLSLRTIMPKTIAPVICHSNSTAATILAFFFEENTNPYFRSKTADKLLAELQELMTVCQKNFPHAQELQKQAHNKSVKPKSYAPGDKV